MAGELKHGTIALIEGTLVVALCTNDLLEPKMISNIKKLLQEVLFQIMIWHGDHNINVPINNPYFKNIINVIPLQLFAYYMAYYRKCDIDK